MWYGQAHTCKTGIWNADTCELSLSEKAVRCILAFDRIQLDVQHPGGSSFARDVWQEFTLVVGKLVVPTKKQTRELTHTISHI